MEHEPTNALRMVMPSHDLYVDPSQLIVPGWTPPLSIDDNAVLHEILVVSLGSLVAANDHEQVEDGLLGIIYICWRKRFPIDGEDIWSMLYAHAVPKRLKADVIDCIDFGLKLLRAVIGRGPVKSRRMPAMSQARYIPKARRKFEERTIAPSL